MELLMILRVILRRRYLIFVPVIVVGMIVVPDMLDNGTVVSGGFATTVRYTAAQQLEAIPDRDGDYQDVWLASELTVNAFTDWVRTSKFAEEVAFVTQKNGLAINSSALSIAADNKRSVGQIFLNWGNDAELAIIANAVIEVLQTKNQAYFPQLGEAPAFVTLLDTPHIAPVPASLPNRFAPFIKLALGFIAGLGLAFLVEYLDPRLHTREELENLGVSVIASIPPK